jgi:hypothetical protein
MSDFAELCAAWRGQLRRSGFCAEAADAIMASALKRVDLTSGPGPQPVMPWHIPALQKMQTVWSNRLAAAFGEIVKLEAQLHFDAFRFAAPPGARRARPEWLQVLEGGNRGNGTE